MTKSVEVLDTVEVVDSVPAGAMEVRPLLCLRATAVGVLGVIAMQELRFTRDGWIELEPVMAVGRG